MINTLLQPVAIEMEAIEIKEETQEDEKCLTDQQETINDNDGILPIKVEEGKQEENEENYEQILPTKIENSDYEDNEEEEDNEDSTEGDEDDVNEEHTPNKRSYKCPYCPKTFSKLTNLKFHKPIHPVDVNSVEFKRPYKCAQCDKRFGRSSDLRTHERIHTGEKPFKCDICGKAYSAKQNLTTHRKYHLGEMSKNYKCQFCEKKFIRNAECKIHMRTHTKEKAYVCDFCQLGYASNFNLQAHIKRKHSDVPESEIRKKPGPKPFDLTEKVQKQKALKDQLEQQLVQKQNKIILLDLTEQKLREIKKNRKIKCEFCSFSSTIQKNMDIHMRDQHGNKSSERTFPCPHCQKSFPRSSSLTIHIRIHTGEKPFKCDLCEKSFGARQNLLVHKKYHMGDASKTYQCEQCDKKFIRNVDLKIHMRSHTGEKLYKCDLCQRGFASKVNVLGHIERDHLAKMGNKKPGPKTKVARKDLLEQSKLIEELQQKLKEIENNDKITKFNTSTDILPLTSYISKYDNISTATTSSSATCSGGGSKSAVKSEDAEVQSPETSTAKPQKENASKQKRVSLRKKGK